MKTIITIVICTLINMFITIYFVHNEAEYCRACIQCNQEYR